MERLILVTSPAKDYELLDSGSEEKLERYGNIVLARPDPQALWDKHLAENEWKKANGRFIREGREGRWEKRALPQEWQIEFGNLNFLIRPTSFKHTGLFAEQFSNWEWARKQVEKARRPVSVINLFGYTGGATLALAAQNASIAHVDASKVAVAWARENAAASRLSEKPIRWIIEDVFTFVEREIRRGNTYDAILMDPPSFGHGPKGELWKIEEHFIPLLKRCEKLLSHDPLFVLVNGYAAGYSSLVFGYNLELFQKKFGGSIEHGELTIAEKGTDRLLPSGIFARWSKNKE